MHLGKTAFDGLELRWIDPASVAAIDPLGEQVHVALQALKRAARQGFLHRACDLGEVAAQRRDGIFDAGRTA